MERQGQPYELKNWKLEALEDWTGAAGNSWHNPHFPDGLWIRTSRIEELEIGPDGASFLLHTHNNVYRCAFTERNRNAGEGFEELNLLSKMGFEQERAEAVLRTMETHVRAAKHVHEQQLYSLIPAGVAGATVLEVTGEEEFYFHALFVRKPDGSGLFSDQNAVEYTTDGLPLVRLGNFYGDPESAFAGVNFAFLCHESCRVKFTDWTTDCEPVYLYNSGTTPIEADTAYGIFVVPAGACYPLTQESTLGRTERRTLSKAEAQNIWDTQMDDTLRQRLSDVQGAEDGKGTQGVQQ